MKRIKDTYLVLIIVVGLIVLSLYTTYSMFTANTTLENVINLFAGALPTDTEIIEYERITVPANTRKTVDLNISNSTTTDLRYGVWYEMVNPTTKPEGAIIAKYIYSDYETTGNLASGDIRIIQIIIVNNSSSDLIMNVGVANSANSQLNLGGEKTLITDEYSDLGTACGSFTHDFTYQGRYEQFNIECEGQYTLEVWGAQGGSSALVNAPGGKGGYSIGSLNLDVGDTLFAYVGGRGAAATTDDASTIMGGGWNGGGNAAYSGGGGGGATDFRLAAGSSETAATDSSSLLSRIIVAGGGGGSYSSTSGTGGAGGGTSGLNGNSSTSGYTGKAGTATSGGAGGSGSYAGNSGTFGIGGNTGQRATNYSGITSGGAGGGGWYGGGAAANYRPSSWTGSLGAGNYGAGGGGGSGFTLNDSTASSTPSGYSVGSDYWLSSSRTYSGGEAFTDFDGTNVTGHEGDGVARISYTSTFPTLSGLTSAVFNYGDSVNLADGVTCNDYGTGCNIYAIKPATTNGLLPGNYSINYIIQDNSGNRYLYKRNITIMSVDSTGANNPELVNGMIPVTYDENNGVWVKADILNVGASWYNYSESRWANMVLVNSSNRSTYMDAAAGTTINNGDILAFFVWIPRYKYKVWNINKIIGTTSYEDYYPYAEGIDVVFESGTETTGQISCTIPVFNSSTTSVTPQTCTGSNGQYYTHPAFTFNGKQLKGIWFGKFEGTGTTSNPTILANTNSAVNSISGDFYEASLLYASTTYLDSSGYTKADSHMIKSTEWGAMAYLSHSNYGRCSGGSCEEVTLNPTSYVTGSGNYVNNTDQSTTGNVYGVYDTSGGAAEFAMGVAPSTLTSGSGSYIGRDFAALPKQYVDFYPMGSSSTSQDSYSNSILGDSQGEVVLSASTTGGWYDDFADFQSGISSFTLRSGKYDDSGAGTFGFHSAVGVAASYIGYRSIMVVTN